MKARTEKTGGFGQWLMPEVKGLIIGSAAILIATVLAALLFSAAGLPLSLAAAAGTVSLALGGFLGGFAAAAQLKKSGLLCGLLCGFLLFLCVTAVSLLAFRTAPGSATLTRLIVLVIAGGLGGIFGVAKATKRRVAV